MTNTNTLTVRECRFCGTSFTLDLVAEPHKRGVVYCVGDCSEKHHRMLTRQSTDDGYDAYRDSQYDVYNPKDWRWGSWDK